jgi:hypothetical protein
MPNHCPTIIHFDALAGQYQVVDKMPELPKDLDEKFVNQLLNNHLKKPYGYDTCEPHYYKIPRRIIAEKIVNLNEICVDVFRFLNITYFPHK